MNVHTQVSDLLPLYISGALDLDQRHRAEAHLKECPLCQADLILWNSVSSEVIASDQTLVAPPGLADRALAQVRNRNQEPGGLVCRLRHIIQLLRSQMPLVNHEIWPASALVVGLGTIAALVSAQAGFIYAIAPLVSAACISLIYGPENDPSFELTSSTPTSPRQILLARLVLVYGYNLVLMLVATLCLLPIFSGQPSQVLLGSLVLSWLAPMTFLSALALLLSLWIGGTNSITATYIAWLVQLLAGPLRSPDSPANFSPAILKILAAYQNFWESTILLLFLALALFAVAVWFAGRKRDFQLNFS